jgi:hypothetical protein
MKRRSQRLRLQASNDNELKKQQLWRNVRHFRCLPGRTSGQPVSERVMNSGLFEYKVGRTVVLCHGVMWSDAVWFCKGKLLSVIMAPNYTASYQRLWCTILFGVFTIKATVPMPRASCVGGARDSCVALERTHSGVLWAVYVTEGRGSGVTDGQFQGCEWHDVLYVLNGKQDLGTII